MKTKSFSKLLIETRERLDISPQAMAFILGIHPQMYRLYESGRFDKTRGKLVKGYIIDQIDNIEIEIQNKIQLLERALRLHLKNAVKKSVKTNRSNGHNLKEKASKR